MVEVKRRCAPTGDFVHKLRQWLYVGSGVGHTGRCAGGGFSRGDRGPATVALPGPPRRPSRARQTGWWGWGAAGVVQAVAVVTGPADTSRRMAWARPARPVSSSWRRHRLAAGRRCASTGTSWARRRAATRDDLEPRPGHRHTFLAPERSGQHLRDQAAATRANEDFRNGIWPGGSGNPCEGTSAGPRSLGRGLRGRGRRRRDDRPPRPSRRSHLSEDRRLPHARTRRPTGSRHPQRGMNID